MKARPSVSGFTLIELMIVVTVIAIIAAIAYPSYRDYVIRSRRSDAKAGLLQAQLAQEKWRANNIAYTTSLTVAPPGGLGLSGTSPDGHYNIGVVGGSVSATTYTLQATPAADSPQKKADKDCQIIETDQNSTQTPEECWS